MGGPEHCVPAAVLVYVVIIAAVALYFAVNDLRRDIENRDGELRREIKQRVGDLQREVGAVKREIEYRANRHDHDLERLLSQLLRSR